MTAQFDSLEAFLAMGGYGGFVWSAWGLSALVIAVLAIRTLASERHWRSKVEQLEREAGERRDG